MSVTCSDFLVKLYVFQLRTQCDIGHGRPHARRPFSGTLSTSSVFTGKFSFQTWVLFHNIISFFSLQYHSLLHLHCHSLISVAFVILVFSWKSLEANQMNFNSLDVLFVSDQVFGHGNLAESASGLRTTPSGMNFLSVLWPLYDCIFVHDCKWTFFINQEALHREQMLENKLATLQRLVENTQEASESGWQVCIKLRNLSHLGNRWKSIQRNDRWPIR